MPYPHRRSVARSQSPETAESDRLDAALTKAGAAAALKVLRDIVKERPATQIRELEQHHIDRISVEVIGAAFAHRAEQEQARKALNDDLPASWSDNVFA